MIDFLNFFYLEQINRAISNADLVVKHLLEVRDVPPLVSGVASKAAHNVIVYPAQVHHVEGVEVHLSASLLPVCSLLAPGLQSEHAHQQTRLGELGSSAVATKL